MLRVQSPSLYPFIFLTPNTPSLPPDPSPSLIFHSGAALDRLVGDGAYNWQIQFNLTFLRLISFCMDRFWSVSPRAPEYKRPDKEGSDRIIGGTSASSDLVQAERLEEERVDFAVAPHHYTLLRMLAYVFYIPLYIAGPIVSFNAFAKLASSTAHAPTCFN